MTCLDKNILRCPFCGHSLQKLTIAAWNNLTKWWLECSGYCGFYADDNNARPKYFDITETAPIKEN